MIDAKTVKESRLSALHKIISILDKGDIESQFANVSGNYYSKDKFIVTWNGNYNGMASEYKIEKCDEFYSMYSGAKAIYGVAGLFHEKQIKSYPSIEMALIDVGLKLCPNRKEMQLFFAKYAQPYNDKLKK